MEDINISQKLILRKEGSNHSVSYQNNNHKMYRTLNENEYDALFNKLRPNVDFSLPDRLIQSFVKDGTILPSYKNSRLFNMEDFESIVSPLKKDMPYLSKLQSGKRRRCNRRGLGKVTMKKGRQYKKNSLLKKLNMKKSNQKTEKKLQKKTPKRKPVHSKNSKSVLSKGKGKGKQRDKDKK